MDKFKEMMAIEEEFGAMNFGDQKIKPPKRKLPNDSMWNFVARKIDSPPAKFNKFISDIKTLSGLYLQEINEYRKRQLAIVL